MRKLLYKSYVSIYRVTAVAVLYGMFAAIAAYAALIGFYGINKSWVAPVLISPSNDKILALMSQMVTSEQALDNLTVSTETLQATRAAMLHHRTVLQSLNAQLDSAANQQKADNAASGRELMRLIAQKHADLRQTESMLRDLDHTTADIERNLKAGLITRSEALAQETTLAQFKNSFTDAQVGEVMLNDNARQKMTTDLSAVETMAKSVELKNELAQLELSLKTGDEQIYNNAVQMASIQKAIRTTQDNPYFVAAQSQHTMEFAFVSWDNQNVIAVDAPVFDCMLSFVVCKKVGTVARIFTEEERATNPILKTDIRGFLVQLTLTDRESAKSKTLFVGREPLFL
jgi:hypothetical protein